MNRTSIITARVSPETLVGLDQIAARRERSRGWIVAKAIERFVAEQTRFDAFLQEGIDAADRGDLISQEAMEAWFDERSRQVAAE